MKVLMSIKPALAKAILDGSKKYAYTRIPFKNQIVDTVVIYATAPVGKVVGEFEVGPVLHETVDNVWKFTKDGAGMSAYDYKAYFKGKDAGYAIEVRNPKRYEKPLIFDRHPPMTFLYLTPDRELDIVSQ